MKYKAHFYCDNCGSRWVTYYKKLESIEAGDCCDKCANEACINGGSYEDAIVETHLYEKVED